MTHWILLVLAVLASGAITRIQYFYFERNVYYIEGVIVVLVLYTVFVLIFNKYFEKTTTDKVIEAS